MFEESNEDQELDGNVGAPAPEEAAAPELPGDEEEASADSSEHAEPSIDDQLREESEAPAEESAE